MKTVCRWLLCYCMNETGVAVYSAPCARLSGFSTVGSAGDTSGCPGCCTHYLHNRTPFEQTRVFLFLSPLTAGGTPREQWTTTTPPRIDSKPKTPTRQNKTLLLIKNTQTREGSLGAFPLAGRTRVPSVCTAKRLWPCNCDSKTAFSRGRETDDAAGHFAFHSASRQFPALALRSPTVKPESRLVSCPPPPGEGRTRWGRTRHGNN